MLSFPIDGDAAEPAGPRELGDVVICPEHTTELREAVVHGVLHLVGMDHEIDDGEMLALQRELLQLVTRAGFVALAGRPNVGKSTLTNAIVGTKVAIVSDRPQTTRRAIRGVATGPDWQLVLVDLPGVQRPRDALTARMARRVTLELADADAALMLLNGEEGVGPGRPLHRGLARRSAPGPVTVAVNKVDRLEPRAPGAGAARRRRDRAGRGRGLPDLGAQRRGRRGARRAPGRRSCPQSPFLYPSRAALGHGRARSCSPS